MMIRFLLSRGANKYQKNFLGLVPLDMYINRFSNKEIAYLLRVKEPAEEIKADKGRGQTLFSALLTPHQQEEEHKSGLTTQHDRDFVFFDSEEGLHQFTPFKASDKKPTDDKEEPKMKDNPRQSPDKESLLRI